MKILSWGDLISEATYTSHSSFEHVLNFNFNEKLVSLVDDKVGAGPLNIVVDAIEPIKILKISGKDILINDEKFPKENIEKYDSEISEVPASVFLEFFLEFIKVVKEKAEPQSCAFLLDAQREENFKDSFGRNFVSQIKTGINDFLQGKFDDGTKKIRGLGFGLTPSGDDLLGGYLLGLSLSEKMTKKDFSKRKNIIFENGLSKNLISNSFLFCYYKGRIDSKLRDLIKVINVGLVELIEAKTIKLIDVGHNSGSDTLTGIILGIYGGLPQDIRV
ncbi:MAG: DUF2877 domain-containing protein [Elusimicrobia bacterium]|nr:DUF2877 domain-containing protein [Elusimicrobiota bacterium]